MIAEMETGRDDRAFGAPCGHEIAVELGWCYLALTKTAEPLDEDGSDHYAPTGISKKGQEGRFNAEWNKFAPEIRGLLLDGAESVTIWMCAPCHAKWLLPDRGNRERG